MAKYIVPPLTRNTVLVKCGVCKALYAPDLRKHPYGVSSIYERCPVCGYDSNNKDNKIPLWKYNLIRYWRELFNKKEGE